MYPSQPSYPAQASAPAMLGPPQPGQGPSYMGAPMAPPPQQLYYGEFFSKLNSLSLKKDSIRNIV